MRRAQVKVKIHDRNGEREEIIFWSEETGQWFAILSQEPGDRWPELFIRRTRNGPDARTPL